MRVNIICLQSTIDFIASTFLFLVGFHYQKHIHRGTRTKRHSSLSFVEIQIIYVVDVHFFHIQYCYDVNWKVWLYQHLISHSKNNYQYFGILEKGKILKPANWIVYISLQISRNSSLFEA